MGNNIASGTYKNISFVQYLAVENWAVSNLLRGKLNVKEGMATIKLRSCLIRNNRKVEIMDDLEYTRLTVRLYGKGVSVRDRVLGKVIGTKNQYLVKTGDFILSRIDARSGAFGIVDETLENAIVTQDFPTYTILADVITPSFFLILTTTKQFYNLCQQASSGTTNRQRISETDFLNIEIPLPTLTEQQRLVDEYSGRLSNATQLEVAANESENSSKKILLESLGIAKNLEQTTLKKFNIMSYSEIQEWSPNEFKGAFRMNSSKYIMTTLSAQPSAIVQFKRGKSPKYDDKGRGIVLNQKCNRWNRIEIEHAKRVNDTWLSSIDKDILTKVDDVIINSTGEGTIGRASVITNGFENLLIDSHLLLLRLNPILLLPRYFVEIVNSEFGQEQIESLKSAKTTQQTELGVQNLLKLKFPFPDADTQRTIINRIDAAKGQWEHSIIQAQIERNNAILKFEETIFN